MKVLYIGHYRDGTGWGNAAANNILALDTAGIDVVPRPITYETQDREYPARIRELESRSNADCETVIQHTLPSNFTYNSAYKNIGCLTVESSNFKSTGWQHHCNLMDEIWVSSEITKRQTIDSGVVVPVKVVPYAININKYDMSFGGQKIQQLEENFTFGFVGEFIERKNIKALLQAFHITFDPREPVNLFIKTSKKSLDQVQRYCEHVRNGLKIRKNYKEEVVIAGMMPEDDYLSVLAQVDCFVMPSRGEACCIPSLEAMALGIPSIWTDGIGMDHAVGTKVKSYDAPCFGAIETLQNLDTANETWKEIDILELSKAMRLMYNKLTNEETKHQYSGVCREVAGVFSYEAVGKKMKEVLDDR